VDKQLIQEVIQAGALGILAAFGWLFFRYLKAEQDYKRADSKSRSELAVAISKMNEGTKDLVAALRDMQMRCTITQEACQQSTNFMKNLVDDLKRGGLKVD
jgi:SAM-dependent MidA family methyltransferase